jgi:predicted RNA-binding protein YlxR (DUF448 family)
VEGIPTRMCLACRSTGAKSTLVRFVASQGIVVVDPAARLPGRGAYVCGREECLEQALRRRGAALHRSFRRSDLHIDEPAIRAAWTQALRNRHSKATAPVARSDA